MRIRNSAFVAALALSGLVASVPAKAYELVIPALEYRTGPYAPNGIPFWNGYRDYFELLNARDGGIEGVKVKIVPCETAYDPKQGVECYEKTKAEPPSGALVYHPLSTGITYQLIPKATADKIPVVSSGYGRTSAANGKIFPWIFNFPATYWSAASIFIKYIGDQEGGMDKLKGKNISLVYHNSAYGKEPIRTLENLAKKHGFNLTTYAVDHPGQEQKATWLQIRQAKPDWVLLWGWGVMNQVAIKEAASIRFPMSKMIGVWWSASDNDVKPAGAEADGYLGGALHGTGADYPVHKDIVKYVYDGGKAADPSFKPRLGEVLYNRGVVSAMYTAEAIKKAMAIHKTKEVKGEHVRDGLEALDVTEADLEKLGFKGLAVPVKITCENHEGPGKAAIQKWDAKAQKWTVVSKIYEPDWDVLKPLINADAEQFAKENNITPRECK